MLPRPIGEIDWTGKAQMCLGMWGKYPPRP